MSQQDGGLDFPEGIPDSQIIRKSNSMHQRSVR